MLVGSKTEVLDGLTSVLWSSQEKGVASGWCSEGQLIQGQDLTSSSDNARSSSRGEAESSNAEFGDGQKTVVVSDGADNDDGLVVRLVVRVGHDPGERNWRSVDARHK